MTNLLRKVLRTKNRASRFLEFLTQQNSTLSTGIQKRTLCERSELSSLHQLRRKCSSHASDLSNDNAPSECESETHKRLNDSNPLHQRDEHAGMFFSVAPEDQMFYKESLSKQFLRSCRAFNEMAVMIRSPALEIFSHIEAANYKLPAVRYGLYGEHGCGKSTTLSHVVHRCAADGWLVVHHPYIAKFLRWYGYRTLVEKSVRNRGQLDSPRDAQNWLQYFHRINGRFLDKHSSLFSTSEEYTFSKKEIFAAHTPIVDLLVFAQDREQFATDVVGVLVKEIKLQSDSGLFRTLVALDGSNALFSEYSYIRTAEFHDRYYRTEDFSLARSFTKLIQNDWKNAAVVCVLDQSACNPPQRQHLPIEVLGKHGFHAMNPFLPVEVPRYSEQEASNMLKYLTDIKFLQHPFAHTDEGRRQLMFFSEMNPLELYNGTLRW